MKYIELTIHTTSEASELVSDVIWEYTDLGVSVCDFNDVLALQRDSSVFWDYMDEEVSAPRTDVLVKCFFLPEEADEKIPALLHEIGKRREQGGGAVDFGTLETARREIDGDDWIDVWKKHFRPIHIGRVVVVPEWIPYTEGEGEETVSLDSSMAFGTGEHETTRMCAELLQEYIGEGDVVLDVGCGSGILGIAAAKLGAKTCYLSDLDPIAVKSATHNAFKSGVSGKTIVSQADLLDGAEVKADLILANITAEVLALLAPSVPGALKEGGTLILSGIIKERLGYVKEKYAAQGLALLREERMGEWYALVYRK